MSVSNGEQEYKIHMSKQVTDKLKTLIQTSPRAKEVAASLKRINEKLKRDPWNFGEQRYHLYDARIQVRVGVVSPIAVLYGISMDIPAVYINSFKALHGA
ncbi:MAG: hypothetical protein L0Y71_00180 [Gemmataceae bacterium]|nr:hypothetical protein [Gemmataceae bacterium]